MSRWMIGVLLLVQWLTSAYACPQLGQPASRGHGEAFASSVPMVDCHGMTATTMDPANPNLCKAHCDADRQAPAAKAQGDVPDPVLTAHIAAVSLVLHRGPPTLAPARGEAQYGEPPGWPPLYLIHQVLRN